ncbi:MAG: bifunctional (p)ppGpp synthetase/guanosine-3',5'-bis(diphosphate) 3'-pyrophosphohydrolase [Candidatus Cloacimonetes bacterium]|nr:bifunctional (p)ppGpp synthetase/guanosine-3',5'-bis(diphosphate) 3'-pyrophosphohydrolase [Candidatus Cloacimonadota bacterium]
MKSSIFDLDNFITNINSEQNNVNIALLKKAFLFSKEAHKDQSRVSGLPYFHHPANVAHILASMKMDSETIVAGLLHDVIEDTEFSYSDIEDAFGEEIANLVDGVSKLKKYNYKTNLTRKEQQAENFRKLLISITKDIRIIFIKLADRLHNMRTIKYLQSEKIERIAQETLDIYAPLANRFGLAKIKWELEDLSFKYIYPEEYRKIVDVIAQKKEDRDAFIRDLIISVQDVLQNAGLTAKITGRSKHFYSIYRKKIRKKLEYEDIYDFAAIRVIVNEVEECYEVLGILQTAFQPVNQRFRDYIIRPKSNNYQSLHTVVIGRQNRKIEIQIRTKKMHLIAEEGIAAHWQYKEFHDLDKKTRSALPEQVSWIRRLLQKETKSGDFLDLLRMNLFPDIIVVMTPNGDYIKLPKHSTPIDLAFAVHTDVGFHCIGARVNGKFVPIRTLLQTGDIVEVLTSPNGHPSKDWLSFMKSLKARAKIRTYFHRKEQEDAIQLGEEIFIKNCRKIHYKIKNENDILQISKQFKINDIQTFFSNLGRGDILFSQIKEFIEKRNYAHALSQDVPEQEERELINGSAERKVAKGVKIGGIDNLMIHYAKCCSPVPGDQILAYTTRGRGITIHQRNCSNPGFVHLIKREPQRILQVSWDYSIKKKKIRKKIQKKIKVIGIQNPNFLIRILGKFSKCHIDLDDINMEKKKNQSIGYFVFRVNSEQELQILTNEILELKSVLKIEKI